MWASTVRWPTMIEKLGDADRRGARDTTPQRRPKRDFWPCDRIKMTKARKDAGGYRMGRLRGKKSC